MRPHALFIESDDGPPPAPLLPHIATGPLRLVRQVDLKPCDLGAALGLITTIYLDQIDFLARKDDVSAFLARGGRIVFNGHVVLPFVEGMQPFIPLAGIPAEAHQAQRGVAGFYGRGHNPPLPGAKPLTGIGPDRLPVDWEWIGPNGGGLFVHSGNDIWGTSDDGDVDALIATRLVDWCLAGRSARVGA